VEGVRDRHKALVIAYGVHQSDRREVIGLNVGCGRDRGVLAGIPPRAARPRGSKRPAVRLLTPTTASGRRSPSCTAAHSSGAR
jgi:tRNA(Ile)-lysidine synthase TilS/MesJ